MMGSCFVGLNFVLGLLACDGLTSFFGMRKVSDQSFAVNPYLISMIWLVFVVKKVFV